VLYENNDDDDPDASEDVPQENSMLFAAQGLEDDDDHVDEGYTNNEYVKPEDPNPNEFEDDAWVNSTYVENITAEFNRYTTPTATEDLKVGDIFKLKVKLLEAITKWSIIRGVSFTPLKTNKTCYAAVCASIVDGDYASRDVCPWRLHASVPKNSSGYFKIRKYAGEHTCSQPSLNSDHHRTTASFVCNVILPILRKKLDMTPGYIIGHIETKYHIIISYYKAWNARTKTLTKIFRDWESSYETLPQYLEALKANNPGTVTATYFDQHSNRMVRFRRVFCAFGPSIEGFMYCRPIFSISGTHLYEKYKGCLLIVTGVDVDGGLYPLAYAVVEGETEVA